MQKHLDELIQSYTTGKQPIRTSFGWIQSTRLALGMSLRQLAHRVGISASALTNFTLIISLFLNFFNPIEHNIYDLL